MTKIIVVDDVPETRLIVAGHLATLNIDHTTVDSVGECLSRLVAAPNEFGLVLMDIHMPNLGGVDATSWVRECEIDPPRNIPIVAMTGDVLFHDQEHVEKNGMVGFISKPVTLEKLRNALNKWFDQAPVSARIRVS